MTLPEPQHGHLPRSPLQLVACQLGYAEPRQPLTASLSAAIVSALAAIGHQYGRVEPVQVSTLALNLSPMGLQSTSNVPVTAYRLLSDDGKWILTLSPDSIGLETPKYGRWEHDFRERFLDGLSVIVAHLGPSVTSRLGLRYVDVLRSESREPTWWDGKVRQAFLGPLLDAPFAKAVRVIQQQVNLELDSALSAVLRHGLFFDQSTETSMRYLIDTDVFRESILTFDLATIATSLERMHTAASSLFQYVITEAYYEELKSHE